MVSNAVADARLLAANVYLPGSEASASNVPVSLLARL